MHKKKVTLKQIALSSGVSSTTVSLVLNGRDDIHISQGTRDRIIKTAGELGYDLNSRIGKKKSLPTILYIGINSSDHNIGTSFFSNLSHKIKTQAAQKFNFLDLVCDKNNMPAQIKIIMESDPVLIITHSTEMYHGLRKHKIKIPIIIPQGEEELILHDPLASVFMVDDRQVGLLAARELISQSYKHCCLIFPDNNSRTVMERQDHFIKEYHNLGGTAQLYLFDSFNPQDIDRLLSGIEWEEKDSLFCYSDAVAIYALKALHNKLGAEYLKLAVIGTDNLYWGQHTIPALTTMDLKEEAMAMRIISEAENLIKGNPFRSDKIRFPVSLITRESTGLHQ